MVRNREISPMYVANAGKRMELRRRELKAENAAIYQLSSLARPYTPGRSADVRRQDRLAKLSAQRRMALPPAVLSTTQAAFSAPLAASEAPLTAVTAPLAGFAAQSRAASHVQALRLRVFSTVARQLVAAKSMLRGRYETPVSGRRGSTIP